MCPAGVGAAVWGRLCPTAGSSWPGQLLECPCGDEGHGWTTTVRDSGPRPAPPSPPCLSYPQPSSPSPGSWPVGRMWTSTSATPPRLPQPPLRVASPPPLCRPRKRPPALTLTLGSLAPWLGAPGGLATPPAESPLGVVTRAGALPMGVRPAFPRTPWMRGESLARPPWPSRGPAPGGTLRARALPGCHGVFLVEAAEAGWPAMGLRGVRAAPSMPQSQPTAARTGGLLLPCRPQGVQEREWLPGVCSRRCLPA